MPSELNLPAEALMSAAQLAARVVRIDYTNYKNIRTTRLIIPLNIDFRANDFHPEPQWLITGIDVDRNVTRSFAMKDIHSWEPV